MKEIYKEWALKTKELWNDDIDETIEEIQNISDKEDTNILIADYLATITYWIKWDDERNGFVIEFSPMVGEIDNDHYLEEEFVENEEELIKLLESKKYQISNNKIRNK